MTNILYDPIYRRQVVWTVHIRRDCDTLRGIQPTPPSSKTRGCDGSKATIQGFSVCAAG